MIGVRIPVGAGNISLHHHVQTDSGARLASYPLDTQGSFLRDKAAVRESDHSPSSRAEVKNGWRYTSTPPIRLRGVVLRLKNTGTILPLP
jgi:hypothetical protein